MSSFTTVLVGLGVISALGGGAGAASVFVRRHRPLSAAMHALRDDQALDPISGPLRAGCGSFEVSVWLDAAGRLQVGDPTKQDAGNAIGPLVLRALALRSEEYGGPVRPGGGSVTLMIEIRESDPDRQARAYGALDAALHTYPYLWTRMRNGVVTLGPVTVVLTGAAVPRHLITAQADRFVFSDGSFGDIGAWGAPVALVPIVSEHWSWRFGWDGVDEIPIEERLQLRQLVSAAHGDRRQVRMFGIPERTSVVREAFWRELVVAGVDVISTREPRHLARFLRRPVGLAVAETFAETVVDSPAHAPEHRESREASPHAVSAR